MSKRLIRIGFALACGVLFHYMFAKTSSNVFTLSTFIVLLAVLYIAMHEFEQAMY
jgi:hypothetical protein